MRYKVTVLGLGYIGLPTALLLAKGGNTVYGYDIDQAKINLLQHGILPFEELGLTDVFFSVFQSNKFFPQHSIIKTPIYLIAVPTPQKRHHADLQYIYEAFKRILPFITDKTLIIVESTIGPSDSIKKLYPYFTKRNKHPLFAYCPERAIPGKTIFEMQHNVRIIGGYTAKAAAMAASLYRSFVKNDIKLTNITTAEACKVMENTYRDVNIALSNEFGKIANNVGFNVWEAIALANMHPRVQIHSPGPGVGGHCIAIDPWYMVGASSEAKLIETARIINDSMPYYVYRQIIQIIKKEKIKKPNIGILGYAYKKNVGDYRESPSQQVISFLKKHFPVKVHDPFVHDMQEITPNLSDVLANANIVIILTDHDLYQKIDFQKYNAIQIIYDTRMCIQKSQVNKSNIHYYLLGSKYHKQS